VDQHDFDLIKTFRTLMKVVLWSLLDAIMIEGFTAKLSSTKGEAISLSQTFGRFLAPQSPSNGRSTSIKVVYCYFFLLDNLYSMLIRISRHFFI
jgi:hypothetical protein